MIKHINSGDVVEKRGERERGGGERGNTRLPLPTIMKKNAQGADLLVLLSFLSIQVVPPAKRNA